jgi:hypothetical protein
MGPGRGPASASLGQGRPVTVTVASAQGPGPRRRRRSATVRTGRPPSPLASWWFSPLEEDIIFFTACRRRRRRPSIFGDCDQIFHPFHPTARIIRFSIEYRSSVNQQSPTHAFRFHAPAPVVCLRAGTCGLPSRRHLWFAFDQDLEAPLTARQEEGLQGTLEYTEYYVHGPRCCCSA